VLGLVETAPEVSGEAVFSLVAEAMVSEDRRTAAERRD